MLAVMASPASTSVSRPDANERLNRARIRSFRRPSACSRGEATHSERTSTSGKDIATCDGRVRLAGKEEDETCQSPTENALAERDPRVAEFAQDLERSSVMRDCMTEAGVCALPNSRSL